MHHSLKSMLGLSLITALVACGQSANKEQVSTGQNGAMAGGGSVTHTAANAFEPVEMKMDEQMAAAVGADAGDNWVRKMIAHHQGAVDMSKIVLDQKPTAAVAKMARMTIDKQGHEIEELTKLEGKGPPNQKSADLYKPAAMTMQRMMMEAGGSTPSETYLRKMLPHHEGAIAMSDAALKSGVTGAIKQQVEKTRADQQNEVEMVKSMMGKTAAERA